MCLSLLLGGVGAGWFLYKAKRALEAHLLDVEFHALGPGQEGHPESVMFGIERIATGQLPVSVQAHNVTTSLEALQGTGETFSGVRRISAPVEPPDCSSELSWPSCGVPGLHERDQDKLLQFGEFLERDLFQGSKHISSENGHTKQ